MKLTYDQETDAAYLCLVPSIADGAVKKTVPINESLHLDYGDDGKLLGIEILDASRLLDKKTLLEAEKA